jgi:hypothetical protein
MEHSAQEQGLANYSPWNKPDLLPAFINEVLLRHGHTQSLMHHLWLLWSNKG